MVQIQELQAAIRYIRTKTSFKPKLAIILGSGLGDFGNLVKTDHIIASSEIPYYPISSVIGHSGKLIFGYVQINHEKSIPLLVFKGRVHYYESGNLDNVVFPIYIAQKLGVHSLLITNASGGINSNFKACDLMLIRDVINLSSLNIPQIQSNKFSHTYSVSRPVDLFDAKLQNCIFSSAKKINIQLQQGTYCWLQGPSYETSAEIRMLKRIGADAVGMSTVPEIVAAKRLGLKTAAISLISNLATGISLTKLSHKEVTETANHIKERFIALMNQVVFSVKTDSQY